MNKKTLIALGTLTVVGSIGCGMLNHKTSMKYSKVSGQKNKYTRNGKFYNGEEFAKRSKKESLAVAGLTAVVISAAYTATAFGVDKISKSERIWKK